MNVLLRLSGRVSRQVPDCWIRQLHPQTLQFDEKWSYVGKKQHHLTPADDPAERDDYGDVSGLDPQSKLWVSRVPGKRTAPTISLVGADTAQRLAPEAAQPAVVTRWRADLYCFVVCCTGSGLRTDLLMK